MKFTFNKFNKSTKRLFSTATLNETSKSGIFGLNLFKNKSTIQDGTKNTIERSKYHLNLITKMDKDIRMIELYDKISNDCCTLIDGATVLYQIHNNNEIKTTSYNAITKISELFESFNHNNLFYNKLLDLYFSPLITSGLLLDTDLHAVLERNIEELSFLYKNKTDNIDPSLLESIEMISNEYQNPSEITYKLEVHPNDVKSLRSNVLRTLLGIAVDEASKNKKEQVEVDFNLLHTIIRKSENEALRNMAYKALAQHGKGNIDKMINILKYRLRYAKALGYKSFAHYQMQHHAVKLDVNNLITSLKQLWIDIRPNLLLDTINLFQAGDLKPFIPHYSVGYYESKVIDNLLKDIPQEVLTKKFITIGNIIEGLQLLTRFAFNKELTPTLDEDHISEDMAHESVLLCNLKEGEKLIAKVYFDLFKRKGKSEDITSQYTVQGSKVLNLYNGNYNQIPIVILSTSLQVNDLDLFNMPVSFLDAKTIFHEYGHVLHSALSKTDFQSISGNRIPLDFAEIPSHLFEYFLYDYSFCKLWMVDKNSGQCIDERLHGLFTIQAKKFANFDLQETLYNSIFDLTIHSLEDESQITEKNLIAIHKNLIENFYITSLISIKDENVTEFKQIMEEYKNEINLKKGLDNFYDYICNNQTCKTNKNDKFINKIESLLTNSQNEKDFSELKKSYNHIYENDLSFTTVTHFKNYPASYYTYIIGKIFSNLIWSDFMIKKDIEKVGHAYENTILSTGNSRNALDAIRLFYEKAKLI
jgi:intermediate peptidase